MKTTEAESSISITCVCPYCGAFLELKDELMEYLDIYARGEKIDANVECIVCKEYFIVDRITY